MKNRILIIGLIIQLVFSSVIPISTGSNEKILNNTIQSSNKDKTLIINSTPSSSINLKNNIFTNNLNNELIKSKEIEIYFSDPQINYNNNYAEITLSKSDSSLMTPGKPVLPITNQIMKFPLGTKIKNIEIVLPEVKQLTLSKSIALAPYPILNEKKIGFIKNIFNNDLYKSSDVYPKEWFDYKIGGGLDGSNHVTFLSIQLFTVKYIQSLNRIEYIEKIKIKVHYLPPENPLTFEDLYDLLIIAPSEYNSNLDLLVEHKNNHGILTKLVNLEEINGTGRDKQEQIKYFIKESIEKWGIRYVLLVGDKEKIPVRYINPFPSPLNTLSPALLDDTPTDLYYADIYDSKGNFSSWDSNNNNIFGENIPFYLEDEVDLYPDVSLGRLCCAYQTEVSDVVNKVICYEENANQEWFDNIIICGGNTHANWKDILFLVNFIFRIYFGKGKPANEGEYIGNKISEILTNFNSEKYYASSILPNSTYKNLTNENINNAINNGVGFVFFIGHGTLDNWGTYPPIFNPYIMPSPDGYTIEQINNLNNENKYPIIIFDACSCGDFKNTKSPIAWEFVKLKSKGAIACFASTDVSFGYPGTYSEKGFNNLINLGIAQAIADGTDKAGDLLMISINNYLNNAIPHFPFNLFDGYIVQIQEMFGDPTLKIGGYQ